MGVTDLQTRDDVERLVRAFYAKALTDPQIGFLFTDVAQLDLEEHVPQIVRFWATMLLGERSYGGGAFGVHAHLHAKAPLRSGHFARWVTLWHATVDELFAGPVAEEAKRHATRVAGAFERRLRDPLAPPPADGLTISLHGPR